MELNTLPNKQAPIQRRLAPYYEQLGKTVIGPKVAFNSIRVEKLNIWDSAVKTAIDEIDKQIEEWESRLTIAVYDGKPLLERSKIRVQMKALYALKRRVAMGDGIAQLYFEGTVLSDDERKLLKDTVKAVREKTKESKDRSAGNKNNEDIVGIDKSKPWYNDVRTAMDELDRQLSELESELKAAVHDKKPNDHTKSILFKMRLLMICKIRITEGIGTMMLDDERNELNKDEKRIYKRALEVIDRAKVSADKANKKAVTPSK